MWTWTFAVALSLGGPSGAAEAPLSAIDWLSRSVEVEPEAEVHGSVSVEPLAAAPRAIGHIPPESVGLEDAIWSGSQTGNLVALLQEMPADMPLPLREALATLVSLEAPAEDPDQAFLLARIDALLALGRLEAAERLIEEAGAEGPALFRRAFDIALLTGHENAGCRALESRPDMSPTYPARIFCLARRGDWQAAALTLETAEALDVLAPGEVEILGRFLDDGEDDLLPPPRRPETITPLVFRLYEAIGEPVPTRGLPLAFAHADLRPQNGWKTRLEAAERLYRAGAIPEERLLDLYMERAPAASGGVWERASAVQAWRRAGTAEKAAAEATAAEALAPAGLGRLLDQEAAVPQALDTEAEPDADLAAMIDDNRQGEAALHAILRAATAWDGDADDLSRAFAALETTGLGRISGGSSLRWAATR